MIEKEIRYYVLEKALLLESNVTSFLGELLDLDDISNTKSLGSKGGALSFNQKINLLIDIGALEPATRSKYQAFMEIRNVFMHNILATDLVSCMKFTNGTEKFILKVYPVGNDVIEEEEKLRFAVEALSADVLKTTKKIEKKIYDKKYKYKESKIGLKSHHAFIKVISELKNIMSIDIVKNSYDKKNTVKDQVDFISNLLYSEWKKNMDKK